MKSECNGFIREVMALANDKYQLNSDQFINELQVMIKIMWEVEKKILENRKPINIPECIIQLVMAIEESRDPQYEVHDRARLLELIRDELYGYLKLKEWCEKPSEMQAML
jgi:hypothetical protein